MSGRTIASAMMCIALELVIAVAFRIDSIESRAFREFIMQAIIKKQTNRPKLVCLWSKNIMV